MGDRERALELAQAARGVAEDVRSLMDDGNGRFVAGGGVGSLATAVELLAEAAAIMCGEAELSAREKAAS